MDEEKNGSKGKSGPRRLTVEEIEDARGGIPGIARHREG